jgi:hypothetical protein
MNIGDHGKDVIKTIFKYPSFLNLLEENSLQLPCQKPLDGPQSPCVPDVILGAEVLAVTTYSALLVSITAL